MKNCCSHTKRNKKCIRLEDKKVFELPRKYTRKDCKKSVKGFSKRSSCAPYKYCNKKKSFLFNPNNPKKSFDVYVDKNPTDTINIKYKTYDDVVNTINKLEKLYKKGKYSHKRIWQVGMIMMVRLRVLKHIKDKEYKLSKKYLNFLSSRTKIKDEIARNKLKFKM